jgi:hypothetical protein
MHKYSDRPVNQILAAVSGAMSELGNSTMHSLLWHLKNKGISLDPQDFVLQSFYEGLQELLGNGADMLMQEIYEHLLKQLGIDYEPGAGLSPVEKIEKIMTTTKSGGGE